MKLLNEYSTGPTEEQFAGMFATAMHRQVLLLATAQALFQTASVMVMTVGGACWRQYCSAAGTRHNAHCRDVPGNCGDHLPSFDMDDACRPTRGIRARRVAGCSRRIGRCDSYLD